MSGQEKKTILGTTTKRLTTRKRTNRRGPQRQEVSPAVRQPNLATPIYGCQIDIFEGTILAEKPEALDIRVTKQEREIILAKGRRRLKNLPSLTIENISYSLYSHEELQDLATFKVRRTDQEGLHTINDPRSGVVDNDKVCQTCLTDNMTCPGHFGIIELNQHIIHPLFRRVVADVLISVCKSCGGLLLSPDMIEEKGILKMSGSRRLRQLAEASKKLPCRTSGCVPNPIYKTTNLQETKDILYADPGQKNKYNIMPIEEIERILEGISDEDSAAMGFENNSHPRRFIMKSIPVIPICSRPPVVRDGEIVQDTLTLMYLNIVRYNQRLLEKDIPPDDRKELVKGLVRSIEQMFISPDENLLDIRDRIGGKEGIIRDLIQGKRVNYSARTVLGPDPNLKFGQIRVPRVFAPYLTYPETISASNIGRLTALFRAGRVTYITPSRGKYEGKRIQVNERIKREYNLSRGDIVERWLQDGDYVAFNRQPTLHKQGFMGYEVVLGDALTIGLHLAYTGPHNADFDGDEGTLHVPQSTEAMLEVAILMGVKNCILNAQNNKNIIGVVMDALAGAYLMTQPETFVDRGTFMNIVSFLENTSGRDTLFNRLERYHIPRTSGRSLFSAILPEDFYYRKGDVLIRDGVLVSGIITKDHIGSSHGSIVQVLIKDYGVDTTVDFLTDIYNIMREWLDVRGFSVGLDDCFLAGDNPQQSIEYEIQRAKMLVKSMGWKLDDPLEEERREKQIIAYLNTAKGLGARISEQNLPASNAFNVMAKSGAKGSTFNIAQITGMLGQQFVQGQRMPESISGGTRCLPYFPENSLDPAARGFCTNSFLTGLRPSELFFHQAGGREGLTDTAVKTAETGAMHHRVVKALEDIKVYNDGSVRNTVGTIFQYIYGEDGFGGDMLEMVNTKTGKFSSFINTKRLAGRINARYGYTTPGEPEMEEVIPIPYMARAWISDLLKEPGIGSFIKQVANLVQTDQIEWDDAVARVANQLEIISERKGRERAAAREAAGEDPETVTIYQPRDFSRDASILLDNLMYNLRVPTETGLPPVPRLPPAEEFMGLKVGDVVNTDAGEGVVQQVDGERVLVHREGQDPTWIKIGKLEM